MSYEPIAICTSVSGCKLDPGCRGRCALEPAAISPLTIERFKPRAVENQFEPDAKLIEHVERLLVDAKSGKLRGLAYAVVAHDGLVPAGKIDWGIVSVVGVNFALGESISRLRHAWDNEQDT